MSAERYQTIFPGVEVDDDGKAWRDGVEIIGWRGAAGKGKVRLTVAKGITMNRATSSRVRPGRTSPNRVPKHVSPQHN